MRRGIFGGVGLVILVVIAIAVYLSIFIISQTQQALVLRFGQVVREVQDPGLYYKLPLIDNVVYFDKRILDLDSAPLEIIASDQKRLVVDAWGRYKIINPLLFFQSVGSVEVADQRLSVLLNSAVRQVLGDATFIQLVRDERAKLMERITTRVDREARSLGVEVVDVKIQRADLPEANSQAIYERMQTERQQEATQIRALGEQQARRIRAEADREAVVIVAEAQKESEQTRGRGEADRNGILAKAFNADPEFFAFYRSMQAYVAGLGGTDTRWVITPDSEFFRFFNDSDALAAPQEVRPEPPAPTPGPATEVAPDEAASPDAAIAAPATSDAPTAEPPSPPPALASDGAVPAPAADVPAPTGDAITIE
jgi:membrane protease subunit HflC